MRDFLKLNKEKLKFAFSFASLSFLVVALVFVAISYFLKEAISWELFFIVVLSAGLIFPLLVIGIAILKWIIRQKNKCKAFSKPPFSEIEKIGFRKSTLNEDSRWMFTEEVYIAFINSFYMICDISREKRGVVEMIIPLCGQDLNYTDYKRLNRILKNYDANITMNIVSKAYNKKAISGLTINKIKDDLNEFTNFLKTENLM